MRCLIEGSAAVTKWRAVEYRTPGREILGSKLTYAAKCP